MDDFQADLNAITAIDAVPTILDVVCRTTGMGFAAIARVTDDRWIACSLKDDIAFGLRPGGELKIDTTICHEIHRSRRPVIIDHVERDEHYRTHPTPALYGFQSYISVPIILADGTFFGTLCAIDPRPARVNTPEITGMFELFAELIAFHLDAAERLATSESSLKEERVTADLREQFIAVLGHDLRNPLGAVASSASLLLRMQLGERATSIAGLIQTSVTRMSGLIDNVMDFARGRLGGGLTLDRSADAPLEPILNQVVAEMRVSSPERVIETRFALTHPIRYDRSRIAQLFSNLLGNALTYGSEHRPVRVDAVTDGGYFTLSIANEGDTIPPAMIESLFHPFVRGADRPNREGLGLGLYIASEIARAHGGSLGVVSGPDETRFTFRMPL